MAGILGTARATARFGIFPALAAACFGDFWMSGASATLRSRVDWLQRSARRHAKWMGLGISVVGPVPTGGLIVSNHVSYLDILALSSLVGCSFVSKREVRHWPVFGAYAKMGGTIFVDRERRSAVADVAELMQRHLDEQIPISLFPEGTSTGGDVVLPFRSSLFEPVVHLGHPVVPCGLRYSLPGGSVPDDVAYWRDMTLATHMPKLLTKTGLHVEIHFGSPRTGSDRKELSRALHSDVCSLAGLAPSVAR